jgi:hypothetical protein
MTTPDLAAEFIAAAAAKCKAGEAALVFITAVEGVSLCVCSEPGAREVAASSAADPGDAFLDDGDTLVAVAVITPDATVTDYPIAA